jgi:apolipoprotein N-acyltransferase
VTLGAAAAVDAAAPVEAGPTPPGGGRPGALAALILAGRCVLAGLTIAASVPPWGWWPLAFVGVAQWDRLLAGRAWRSRFRRSWLVTVAWLLPGMLWMYWLTPPGYVAAGVVFAGYFAVAAAACPSSRWRWLGLPGAIVLAEAARWAFPWEGVPLATLAMGQATSPVGQAARLGGALLVAGLVAVGGVGLSAAWERRWTPAAAAAGLVVALSVAGWAAPRGEAIGPPLRMAVVQGGGPQGVVGTGDEAAVFRRHLDASRTIAGPVDLVVWPENTVGLDGLLEGSEEDAELRALAQELGAPLVVGVTEEVSDTEFTNASVVYLPDGALGDRYDKVRRVPFGEWVPFRPLIEKLAGSGSGLPGRNAVAGTGPAMVDTPAGPMGVAISWEVFFTDRATAAAADGGQVLLNPTNGSSYTLTQVQSQQVASSQLRAIETGRWVVQAAPTGFSTIVDPGGRLAPCTIDGRASPACRTGISERAVIVADVENRVGDTFATRMGPWPTLVAAVMALAAAWVLPRRRVTR